MNTETKDWLLKKIDINSSWVDDWGENAITVKDLYNILNDIPVI